MLILYFDYKHAIDTHDTIINISGGRLGVRDAGLLESTFEHIKNDDYYPDISEKLTHLVFSVAMNHSFVDGNKRSSIALGGFFLEINGYGNRVGPFILEMENIVLWLAQKKINKNMLFRIVDSILKNGELTHDLKIELLSILE